MTDNLRSRPDVDTRATYSAMAMQKILRQPLGPVSICAMQAANTYRLP